MNNKEFKLIKMVIYLSMIIILVILMLIVKKLENVKIVLRLEWELYFQTNRALKQNVMNG